MNPINEFQIFFLSFFPLEDLPQKSCNSKEKRKQSFGLTFKCWSLVLPNSLYLNGKNPGQKVHADGRFEVFVQVCSEALGCIKTNGSTLQERVK